MRLPYRHTEPTWRWEQLPEVGEVGDDLAERPAECVLASDAERRRGDRDGVTDRQRRVVRHALGFLSRVRSLSRVRRLLLEHRHCKRYIARATVARSAVPCKRLLR